MAFTYWWYLKTTVHEYGDLYTHPVPDNYKELCRRRADKVLYLVGEKEIEFKCGLK